MIEHRLRSYANAWAGLLTDPIAACWAPQFFAFYKAEEISRFYTSWPEVLAYWHGNEALHAEVALEFGDVQECAIGDDKWLGLALMEWRIRFRDDAVDDSGHPFRHRGKSMAGFNHVLSLWTGAGDDVRLIGWCEAPDAAPIYISELYTRVARHG